MFLLNFEPTRQTFQRCIYIFNVMNTTATNDLIKNRLKRNIKRMIKPRSTNEVDKRFSGQISLSVCNNETNKRIILTIRYWVRLFWKQEVFGRLRLENECCGNYLGFLRLLMVDCFV